MKIDYAKEHLDMPGNETHAHFFLKQVGKAYLRAGKGCRFVANEVHTGNQVYPRLFLDYPEFDNVFTIRKITDVIGIDTTNKSMDRLEDHDSELRGHEDDGIVRNIEVKTSLSDVKNGFCIAGDYNYLMVPKELYEDKGDKIEENIFDFVGILTVDFKNLNWDDSFLSKRTAQFSGVELVEYPKFSEYGQHRNYIKNWVNFLKKNIAQRAIIENVYKNPWFYPDFNVSEDVTESLVSEAKKDIEDDAANESEPYEEKPDR